MDQDHVARAGRQSLLRLCAAERGFYIALARAFAGHAVVSLPTGAAFSNESELRLGGSAFVRGCVRLLQHLLLMLSCRQRTTTSSACIHVLAARRFVIRL